MAEKLLVRSISTQAIREYLDSSIAPSMLRRLIKKACCAHKEAFEFNDITHGTQDILEALQTTFSQLAQAVSEQQDILPRLEYASSLINKYICFNSSMVTYLEQICNWCFERVHSEPQKEALTPIAIFLVNLLAAYPLNTDQSTLFEGAIWDCITALHPVLKNDMMLSNQRWIFWRVVVRCYKYIHQIYTLNPYTIEEQTYQNFILNYNAQILSFLHTFNETPVEQRNAHTLHRLYKSISTLYK